MRKQFNELVVRLGGFSAVLVLVLFAGLDARAVGVLPANITEFSDAEAIVAAFAADPTYMVGGVQVRDAQCTTDGINPNPPVDLTHPFEIKMPLGSCEVSEPGFLDMIENSGFDTVKACIITLENGEMNVSANVGGPAGDSDGNCDPDAPGVFQTDANGISDLGVFQVGLVADVESNTAEYTIRVTQVNTGGNANAGLGQSAGQLCDQGDATARPDLMFGANCTGGAELVGSYKAGTTGPTSRQGDNSPDGGATCTPGGGNTTDEMLVFIDDVTDLPGGRAVNPGRTKVSLLNGTSIETCSEDRTQFILASNNIELEKNARAICTKDGYFFFSDYEITNSGLNEFDKVVLNDVPVLSDGTLPAVQCQLSGDSTAEDNFPFTVVPGANGAFMAMFGPLQPADFDDGVGTFPNLALDIDCGTDGNPNTPNCGTVTVSCSWGPVPLETGDKLVFNNLATVDGLINDQPAASDEAEDMAMVVFDEQTCGSPEGKEHEGVGYDNLLNLKGDADYMGTPVFGSAVDPQGTMDVSLLEGFTAQGAFESPLGSGKWHTVPANTLGVGTTPTPGIPALFTWRIMVSKVANTQSGIDIACSMCAGNPWYPDNAVETYTPDGGGESYEGGYGHGSYDWRKRLMVKNSPVLMAVRHECGPFHHDDGCTDSTMYGIEIPGLERVLMYGKHGLGKAIEFLGCKPKLLSVDNFRNTGYGIAPGDIIEIRIFVPGTERAQLWADVTSCELAYLPGSTSPDQPR